MEKVMTDEDQSRVELERRLAKDWGPEMPAWKRRLSAIFIIVAFFGLVLAAVLTASR
jgi:hypothetical protein